MNAELTFLFKVLRNGLILTGAYFFSVYAANDVLTYAVCKPVLIFLGTYVFAELMNRYGLKPQTKVKSQTLLF